MLSQTERERIKSNAVAAALALHCPTCGSHVHELETGPIGIKYRCAAWCARPIFVLCWPNAKAKEFSRARRDEAERAAEKSLRDHEEAQRSAQPRHRFIGGY